MGRDHGVARARHQHRVVTTLSLSQVFSGIGNGAALAVGSLMAAELSGSDALAGTTTMALSLAGALSALPLARLALAKGRRITLSTAYGIAAFGALGMIVAPMLEEALPGIGYPVLVLAALLIGLGGAGNLQARFAATDLAEDRTRGRDLGIVVWSITVGAVSGPNLIGPGSAVAEALGLPETSGPFLFSLVGMVLAVTVLQIGLRPDPLHLRPDVEVGQEAAEKVAAPRLRDGLKVTVASRRLLLGVGSVVAAHTVMVGIMAMTSVHLSQLAAAEYAGHAGQATGGHHHTDADTLVVIGLVISLHIAGMYALSPLVGLLADRWGRLRTMALGEGVLLGSCVTAFAWPGSRGAVTVALILLGLGWSLVTVAGSAYVSEHAAGPRRVLVQGVTDAGMGAGAAVAAALSGLIMAVIGFHGLAVVGGVICLAGLAGVLAALRHDLHAYTNVSISQEVMS
ncbi:MFS transporter [Micrococcus lylae]|uniref:MFS transporter n=1 Tax=Micrococcus lylae TaxID=1273 RepID=A0ABY2K1H5_9MICC|nr:MFS transporter [Micrococcus lylae]TFI00845.1 MFS transporter [Micrococcus lylae]